MGFKNSTSCSCCKETCNCECPEGAASVPSVIVTLDGFTAATEYDCGICADLNGEFELAGFGPTGATSCLFDPPLTLAETMNSCRYGYSNAITGPLNEGYGVFCGNYEPILTVLYDLFLFQYCAYEKDGKIYREALKPVGAKLVGRAFELRLLVQGYPQGVYDPGNYCYAVPLDHFINGYGYGTSFDLCYTVQNQYGFFTTCCDVESGILNTLGSCGGFYPDAYQDKCFRPYDAIVYGLWAWRTILPINRKCGGMNETLRMLTDEEMAREYVFADFRQRAPVGSPDCQLFDLCNAPLTVKMEF